MFQSRRVYLSLLSVVALLTTTSCTVFSIVDAAVLSSRGTTLVALPIAASTFDLVSLFGVATFSHLYVWRKDGVHNPRSRGKRVLVLVCILLSAFALVISLAKLVTIKRRLAEVTAAATDDVIGDWDGYLAAQFTIWTSACLTQAGLYSVPLWNSSRRLTLISVPYSAPRDSVMSEARTSHQTTNLYVLEPALPSSPLGPLQSPTFSARSSQSLRSWRESLHQAVRPVTSRSRLINRPSLSRDSQSLYSDGNSVENASQVDGFENWDTSSVSISTKDAVMLVAPSRGTVLETIPGSRPVSPARALDGPFPVDAENHETNPLSLPPKLLPDTSRPPSPAVSEAHIHPLFRTESPVPPPEVLTSSTNVLASPLSTHMIACPPRPYSRMRSGSRTASPSLLQRSSRSPSPPSRELTPPIPDFVLNSSPRSSTSGTNSRRKINLHLGSNH
jgi:hypothetical protein